MVKALLLIAFIAFLLSFPFSQGEESVQQSNLPQPTPRSCLRDSDIDTSAVYRCQSGPNRNSDYYRVMQNVVISKKSFVQGDWDRSLIPLPPSCEGFVGTGATPGALPDRAVRESRRCPDPEIYEIWCGDYCDRVIEQLFLGNQNPSLCGEVPGDENQYLGCFNKAFILKLKDGETFSPDSPNTFDLYIKAGESIPDQCLNVATRYRELAAARGITFTPQQEAQLQCLGELQVVPRCPD